MKYIKLSRGFITKVDDEVYKYLMQWKWYCNLKGYAVRNCFYTENKARPTIWMHKEIMKFYGEDINDKLVDHIDGDKLDNRRVNLRVCTKAENCRNCKKSSTNSSGYKGVSWHESSQGWQARIGLNGKSIYLGVFPTNLEAAKNYNEAAKKYHGEFARLNNLLWEAKQGGNQP